MDTVIIGDKKIGRGERTFIIAEVGSNHDCSLEQAKKLIDAAADAGVDAVKFQSFTAEHIVNRDKKADNSETVFDILKRIELPREWHEELNNYARIRNIIFLSSPFDYEAVDMLDELGVPAFKVASGELTNISFLKYVAGKGKPIILSTGFSTMGEAELAVNAIRETGNDRLLLLHCVGAYPSPPGDVNLRVMDTLSAAFDFPVGYSDHTLGIEVPLAAVARGAAVIEKHFTLSKKLKGPDHFYALEPDELSSMIKGIRIVESALGCAVKRPVPPEMNGRIFGRRSIYACEDILKGTIITENMIKIVRPALGLNPVDASLIIGRKARADIVENELITWDKV